MTIDYNMLPKVVLLEGVNQTGKSTLAKRFREAYGNIEIIKFPYHKFIVDDINAMWVIANMSKGDIIPSFIISQIHYLFDYDFRLFLDTYKDFSPNKVYFFDRYFTSNLVYSRLHGIKYPEEFRKGHITPSVVIFLRATERDFYIDHHRSFDEKMRKIFEEVYGGGKVESRLSPERLFDDGQKFYEEELSNLVGSNLIDNYVTVDALKDTTFRAVERALQTNGIL